MSDQDTVELDLELSMAYLQDAIDITFRSVVRD